MLHLLGVIRLEEPVTLALSVTKLALLGAVLLSIGESCRPVDEATALVGAIDSDARGLINAI